MRRNQQSQPLNKRDTYGKAFIQVTNLWPNSPEVAQFVMARRFAKIAADLMKSGLAILLPGLEPGDFVESPLNPLVFSR